MRSIVIAATWLLTLGGTVNAEELVIGRWCDRMAPAMPKLNRIVTIRINDAGTAELHSAFGDGSEATSPLDEISGGTFRVRDSSHGDTYRIVQSSGEIQLLDKDGFIRSASRLENVPTPGECSR